MAAHSTSVKLPGFLQKSETEIRSAFADLESKQRDRVSQGLQQPLNPADPPSQWSRLTGDGIVARNRYLNVEPFAQNRVKLQVAEGQNDYINASPICLGTRRYIATQGPKDTSVNHFYRMVASPDLPDPVVVVMLTRTHEAGREKCFQYYPLSEDDRTLPIDPDDSIPDGFQGQVHLQDIKTDLTTRSEIRHLRLTTATNKSARSEKSIIHCLFSGWPDFLVPKGQDRAALVQLVRLSARLNAAPSMDGASSSDLSDINEQSIPRIIHCSAGVGRSGTFIALDYLLHLMDTGNLDHFGAEGDPIEDIVGNLRKQRMMMVQSESQFNFLYDVMRDLLTARLDAGRTDQHAVAGAADDRG